MQVFIWRRAEKVSDYYHSEGGLVVFAQSEARAREIANETDDVELQADEKPDAAETVADYVTEEIFIFPDKGCC